MSQKGAGLPAAVIFDLDGTLVHSAPDLHFAVNETLSTLDRDRISLDQVISFIGNGVPVLVDLALTATGGSDEMLHRKALQVFLKVYEANMTRLTVPYPGVTACLEVLRDAGCLMGVCTNKPERPAHMICDDLGLSQYFETITGAREGLARKPDADPLLSCLNALGVAPDQALYVGDSAVDFHTAQNAGVKFRLFSGGYLNAPLTDLPAAARFDDWQTADLT
ncbi:phosphoglycolate phosphatase [uncultured Roseobacter sp.]|uniref:phosphoglycolate phosphatase n=1 Tax=uncultured Roseobacter sp. TaxID=114847 RepID=UPI002628F8C2|nr:phosphoglycolate phosphatase [uncultured Roseobacter sp.]